MSDSDSENDKKNMCNCIVHYLSLEDVQGKSIEATDNSLLNIKTEAFDRPHSRKQKTRLANAEHVDVSRRIKK